MLIRGVCDIARANRLRDAEAISAGMPLIIPAQVCKPSNTGCYLVYNNDTTNVCVNGGPHSYTSVEGDTPRKIALALYNITIDALYADTLEAALPTDPDGAVTTGSNVKIPLCGNSTYTITPYELIYGTVTELAAEMGTTTGQISAINGGYTHSDANATTGPNLVVPYQCTNTCGQANCTLLF